MEFMSAAFVQALIAIILIDLVLAGDNAIVIGLAARKLPPDLQKKAVFWGAIGAVAVRAVLTMGVVWLLKIPGFLLVGGLALIWIAYQLVADDGADEHHIDSGTTFRAAIQTIIVADTIMGVDNVLAVAGAAHGSFALVIFGLLVSIPIVMWGSTLILKWVERFPVIIIIGAAVLGWTSAKMIIGEPLIGFFFAEHAEWRMALYAFCIGIIVCIPALARLRGKIPALPVLLVFTLAWLSVFNYLGDTIGSKYFPDGGAPVSLYLFHAATWLGWIPFVMMLRSTLRPAEPAKAG